MPTVSDAARVAAAARAVWRTCASCDVLFPAGSDQRVCRDCESGAGSGEMVQPGLFIVPVPRGRVRGGH